MARQPAHSPAPTDGFARLLAGGAIALLIALGSTTTADPDLWGHVRFGVDILHSLEVPTIDPYSFTQDRPWINHEWLSELQMGLAYTIGGPPGLALLKGLIAGSALLIIWSALRGTDLAVRMISLAAAGLMTLPITITLRPQLWSLLCLTVLCRILVSGSERSRRYLPWLFVLWANLHGGWIVGLAVLYVWSGVDSVVNRRRASGWILTLITCTLATLVTPYGWKLWAFLSSTVRMTRDITEWSPLWATSAVPWILWIAALLLSIWAGVRKQSGWLQRSSALTLLAFLSLRVVRIGPLFAAAAVLLASPVIRASWPARHRSAEARTSPMERLILLGMFATTMVLSVWIAVSSSLRCIAVDGGWVPDPEAAHVLDGAAPGRLLTSFNWGEFAIWHWGPHLRVAIDGRRETVYSERLLEKYRAVVEATPDGVETLAGWQPHYVWLPSSNVAIKEWLAGHGYRIELETAHSFVALRADLPRLTEPLNRPARFRCFPG